MYLAVDRNNFAQQLFSRALEGDRQETAERIHTFIRSVHRARFPHKQTERKKIK